MEGSEGRRQKREKKKVEEEERDERRGRGKSRETGMKIGEGERWKGKKEESEE